VLVAATCASPTDHVGARYAQSAQAEISSSIRDAPKPRWPRRASAAEAEVRHGLFYGIARILIERDWIDREFIDAHTNGFAEFAQFVESFTLERVVAATGLSAETLQRFADLIHAGKRVSFWWTMGVNQSYQECGRLRR